MAALVAGAWHTHDHIPAADVVETTAKGDGFNSGDLAPRLTGATVSEAFAAGSALAARVVAGREAVVEAAID